MVGTSTVLRGVFTVILAGIFTWYIGQGVKAVYADLASQIQAVSNAHR